MRLYTEFVFKTPNIVPGSCAWAEPGNEATLEHAP